MKASSHLLAAALLLCGAGGAGAEPQEKGPRGAWTREARRERMKEALGLSEEQAGKLKSLRRAHVEAAEELRGKLRASMRKLQAQLEDKAGDKELSATLDSIAASRKALAGERERFESALSAVLTPSQRAQMLAARARMMRRSAMGRGFGGPRRGRGWPRSRHGRAGEESED